MEIVKLAELVSSASGIYQGQELAERYPELIDDDETRQILLAGPDHPEYMEVFSDFVFSYSNDRDFFTFGEGAPDLYLATPDDETQDAIMDLADQGNKVMRELVHDYRDQWVTKEDILYQIQDYPYQTPECKAECDSIREALK